MQASLFTHLKHTRYIYDLHTMWEVVINSLAPGKLEWHFRWTIIKAILVIGGCGISCKIARRLIRPDGVSQHWFRWRLGAVRQPAFTWAIVDKDKCRHTVLLGHNELNHFPSVILSSIQFEIHHINVWKYLRTFCIQTCAHTETHIKHILLGNLTKTSKTEAEFIWNITGKVGWLDRQNKFKRFLISKEPFQYQYAILSASQFFVVIR